MEVTMEDDKPSITNARERLLAGASLLRGEDISGEAIDAAVDFVREAYRELLRIQDEKDAATDECGCAIGEHPVTRCNACGRPVGGHGFCEAHPLAPVTAEVAA
jgi:hypothetical protein